jgi:hypothetical protein
MVRGKLELVRHDGLGCGYRSTNVAGGELSRTA